jgi:hypothetical protein
MASVLDTNNALISLTDLKAYLSADTSDEFLTDTSTDNEIERIINAASIWANRYTGVDLLSREHTEYYDGDGGRILYLDNFPVTSSVSELALYVDTDREYNDDDKIESGDIILYSALGKIVLEDAIFSTGYQSVKITYTAGYALASVPADLAYAIKLICAAMWKKKKDKLVNVTGVTLEGTSVTLTEKDIPALAKEILDEFARLK